MVEKEELDDGILHQISELIGVAANHDQLHLVQVFFDSLSPKVSLNEQRLKKFHFAQEVLDLINIICLHAVDNGPLALLIKEYFVAALLIPLELVDVMDSLIRLLDHEPIAIDSDESTFSLVIKYVRRLGFLYHRNNQRRHSLLSTTELSDDTVSNLLLRICQFIEQDIYLLPRIKEYFATLPGASEVKLTFQDAREELAQTA